MATRGGFGGGATAAAINAVLNGDALTTVANFPWGVDMDAVIGISKTFATFARPQSGQQINVDINPATDISTPGDFPPPQAMGLGVAARVIGAHNVQFFEGLDAEAAHEGSGTVGHMVGAATNAYVNGAGTVTDMIGNSTYIAVYDVAGTATRATAFWAGFENAGTITDLFGVYISDMAGLATNPYPFWSDTQGVFRIKADSSFDAVSQSIPALYNPQFTKYTPGAANHERLVLGQWNGNVAEIGTEKGGTGTQRGLRLLGPSLDLKDLTASAGIAVASTHTVTISVGGTPLKFLVSNV